MRVIKRYPNRKLYDTDAKQYVTLNGIAELIRAGNEVQVTDHATGEDLTAVTLTQIIFEQEKRQGGFLPRSVLTGLVQAGGERLSTLRRTLASPLDLFRHVDEEIEARLRTLIQRGELAEEEALGLRDKLLAQGRQQQERYLSALNEDHLTQLLAERGVPSRSDVKALESRLEILGSKLDAILAEEDPSGAD